MFRPFYSRGCCPRMYSVSRPDCHSVVDVQIRRYTRLADRSASLTLASMSMHLRRTRDLLTSQPQRHPDPSALSQYASFPSPSDYARFRRQPLPLGASHPLSVTPAPLSIQPAHAHASVASHPSRPPVRPSPLLVLASHSMVPSGPFSVRSAPARAPPDQSRYGPVRAISSSSAPLHRECPHVAVSIPRGGNSTNDSLYIVSVSSATLLAGE